MYKILCDNTMIFDSRVEELAVISPIVKLDENKAGSFSFVIPPAHQYYNLIEKRKSIISVYQDADLLFCGMCIEISEDFYKQREIYCEGELSYLNDSIQRPARYQGYTVLQLLNAFVAAHNLQVEANKQFTVGMVTVTDPNDYIYCYTNMESTMKCLKEDLVDDLGGFFRVRHQNGTRYLDYLADSPNTNSQIIKIGKNLMDFASNIDSAEIATAIIPLGAKLETSSVPGLEERLTIKSVNNNVDYVYDSDAVAAYGWITKPVTWDDVTTASILKTKGLQYLSDIQYENMVIEAQAVDLHLADSDIERFKLSDSIRVLSAPHGLDRYFRLTKLQIDLNNPSKNKITLGKDMRMGIAAKVNKVNAEIMKAIAEIVPAGDILTQAQANATALITSAMGGYVYKTESELYIMDTNDPETATKVWRWNLNGLGYSSTGINGTYGLAMTMDGSIVADFITTGTLSANRINGGELVIGGANNARGIIKMLDNQGTEVGSWNNTSFITKNATSQMALTAAQLQYFVNNVKKGGIWGLASSGIEGIGIRSIDSFIMIAGGSANSTVAGYRFNPSGYTFSDGYPERNVFFGDTRFASKIVMANGAELSGGTYDSIASLISSGGFYAYGSIGCSGTKYRVVNTEHHGKVGMNAFETAEAYFSDLGSGTVGADGTVKIEFDSVFAETIETDAEYQVFLTRTSQKQTEWVDKQNGFFVVHGEAGATFDWMLCCKQKGFSNVRMQSVHVEEPVISQEERGGLDV